MKPLTEFDRRLADAIAGGAEFSIDTLTLCGELVLDAEHLPNAKQSGLGGKLERYRRRGIIEPTGEVMQSCSPHRKGGIVRLWRGTEVGRLWAKSVRPRPKARLPEGEHRELTVDEIHRLLGEPEVP